MSETNPNHISEREIPLTITVTNRRYKFIEQTARLLNEFGVTVSVLNTPGQSYLDGFCTVPKGYLHVSIKRGLLPNLSDFWGIVNIIDRINRLAMPDLPDKPR